MNGSFERIFDVLTAFESERKYAPGVFAFRNGRWRRWDRTQLLGGVELIRKWLIKQGLKEKDRVLTIPDMGSPEWLMFELACQINGLVIVPAHKTYTREVLSDILLLTTPRLCITFDSGQYHKVKSLDQGLPTFHLEYNTPFCLPILSSLLDPRPVHVQRIEGGEIDQNNLVCIMLTSGTTGMPKGVSLSHKNIVSNINAIRAFIPVQPGHRIISFLPFSHIFERTACWTYLSLGVDLYFSSGKDHLIRDFQQVKPHFFTAVPRMLEKTYDYVIGMQLSANPIKRMISKWAIKVGKESADKQNQAGLYHIRLWLARQLFFKYWHKRMGGEVRWIAVGAAALSPAIAKIFEAAGVLVREGYGMTETSPVISFNRFDKKGCVMGSVGRPIDGVEVKLEKSVPQDDYGEIYVRGDNVMRGYYHNSRETSLVLSKDGWLKTGDVGTLDEQGFLYITDRAKDIFKTSSGKYIAPAQMEQLFCTSAYIHQCLYVGANKPFPIAVIVPNFHLLKKWSQRNRVHWTSPQYMVHNVKVMEKIQEQIDHINHRLPNFKRIRNFVLSHEEWTTETGEVSSSLKIIRKNILLKYQKEINKLYPDYH